MPFQSNWSKYISGLRTGEIQLIRDYFHGRIFNNGLEIGAGNGFQSKLIVNFVKKLTCTELNEFRLVKSGNNNITYMICDAEKIDSYFTEQKFDFVYSAHLMEHLPAPEKAINGIYTILENGGVAVHIIPSSLNAFLRIILWYPNIFISLIRKYLLNVKPESGGANQIKKDNNLKTERSYNNSKFRRHIIPRPHGVSKNIFAELKAFSKKRWTEEFTGQNFKIVEIIKGPVHSGYGLGFDTLRKFLYSIGLAGEYIYIMRKDGR